MTRELIKNNPNSLLLSDKYSPQACNQNVCVSERVCKRELPPKRLDRNQQEES